MPYIVQERRDALSAADVARNVGELTYVLQTALSDYLKVKGLCYQTIAEISGAVHQLGRDFDERVVAPYEESKRVENGDVWSKKFTGRGW